MVKYILPTIVSILLVIIFFQFGSKVRNYKERIDQGTFVDSLKFDSVVVDGLHVDTFTIDEGTFKINTFVLLTDDTIIVKRITGWDTVGFATGLTTEGFMWISDPYDRGLVAHELFHVAWNTLQFSNVPISEQTEEVLAYETGRLTTEFYKKWFNK